MQKRLKRALAKKRLQNLKSNLTNSKLPTFADRHIGIDRSAERKMLAAVGAASLAGLVAEAVPRSIAEENPLAKLPEPLSESEAIAELCTMANSNEPLHSMIGQGYSPTFTPPVIRRNMLENPSWYTPYTPYQSEISQGRLTMLLNFQQVVIDLTGLPVAGASLLDEATAAAEAMAVCARKSRATRFLVASDVFPQTLDVLATRNSGSSMQIELFDPDFASAAALAEFDFANCAGVLLQYPGARGRVRDFTPLIKAAKAKGAMAVVAACPLALSLLKPPAEMGADMAVGSMQSFGVPLWYGGPHAAYIAASEPLKRFLPGRIIGVSKDRLGRQALRMALQTREQHIRRQSATSNICTAQALPACAAAAFAIYQGFDGITAIAKAILDKAKTLRKQLFELGFTVDAGPIFNTVYCSLKTPKQRDQILAKAKAKGSISTPVAPLLYPPAFLS